MLDGLKMLAVYAQERLGRIRTSLSVQPPPQITISVVSGLQAGSEVELTKQAFRIGDSVTDELFLLPKDGEKGSVDVSFGQVANVTLVSASTDRKDVYLDDLLVTSEAATKRLPCKLKIDGDVLCVSRSSELSETDTEASIPVVLMASLLMVMTLIVGWMYLVPTERFSTSQFVQGDASSDGGFQDASAIVEAVLAKAGLSERVEVTSRADSVVEISGTISRNDLGEWQTARSEIEIVLADFPVIYNVRSVPVLTNFPAISLVTQAPQKFVILLDGQKVEMGDTIVENWKLSDIREKSLILQNVDELIEVSFGNKSNADQ